MPNQNDRFANDVQAHVEESAIDLQVGMKSHDLGAFIDDLNHARNEMKPAEYGAFLLSLNSRIDTDKILPNTGIDIIGLDESGKKLVVADTIAGTGLIVNRSGQVDQSLTTPEVATLALVPQATVKLADLANGDSKFSSLLPPGLDTTGDGKFKPKNLKEEIVEAPDRSVTRKLSGELSDAESARNWRGSVSRGDTSFNGYYTTSADGQLLRSHIEYSSKYDSNTWIPSRLSDLPQINIKSQAPHDGSSLPLILNGTYDSKYIPLRGTYVTLLDTDNNVNFYGSAFETAKQRSQSIELHTAARATGNERRDQTKADPNVKRDASGLVSEINYEAPGLTPAQIRRNSESAVSSLTDKNGTVWTNLFNGKWNKMDNGKAQDVEVEIAVEGGGNIVFKSADQTRIDTQWGASQIIDQNGRVVESQYIRYGTNNSKIAPEHTATVTTQFAYSAKGTPLSQTQTTEGVEKTTVEHTRLSEAPKPYPIQFFTPEVVRRLR